VIPASEIISPMWGCEAVAEDSARLKEARRYTARQGRCPI
jgi:hypothetical protein